MKLPPATRLALMLFFAWQGPAAPAGQPVEWSVAAEGGGGQTGSGGHRFPSIQAALAAWVAEAPSQESLRLVVHGGRYALARPILISGSGTPGELGSVSIEAAPGEVPILDGGVAIRHWERVQTPPPGLPENACGKVWAAEAPREDGEIVSFRQLWVNDAKAVRAREPNLGQLARLAGWDKTNQTAEIGSSLLHGIGNPAGLEVVIDQVWEIASLRVLALQSDGASACLRFRQPESQIEFAHPWPPVTVNAKYQAPFYLANALQFLDSPGEWFEDVAGGKVYYWPRDNEDMATASVSASSIETLLKVDGSAERPVANVHFKGLTFAGTAWLRPAREGHVPLQAGMAMLDARKLPRKGTAYNPKLDNVAWIERPPAAVKLVHATNVSFEGCTFTHVAAAGLDIGLGCRDVLVEGCTFRDVGGNGIQLGMFSDPKVETHTPYNPTNAAEVCERIEIKNNVLADCGNEDWGCVGIAAGYVRGVTLAHNEIHDLPYSGISVGWGWTKQANVMRDNRIIANHIWRIGQTLGDLGGIYTLSAQPGTLIAENVIEDIRPSGFVPDPEHWFYIYLDEGSSGITVRDNWCPAAKFLQNANGPGNVWLRNGPEVPQAIKSAAGIEPEYRFLLK